MANIKAINIHMGLRAYKYYLWLAILELFYCQMYISKILLKYLFYIMEFFDFYSTTALCENESFNLFE